MVTSSMKPESNLTGDIIFALMVLLKTQTTSQLKDEMCFNMTKWQTSISPHVFSVRAQRCGTQDSNSVPRLVFSNPPSLNYSECVCIEPA